MSIGSRTPFPLPLGSVEALKHRLDAALALARAERGCEDQADGVREGPSRLARAYDRARRYAFPADVPDWHALDRARRHREEMQAPGTEFASFATEAWAFIGPRRFDTSGGRWTSGRVNTLAIDPSDGDVLYAGSAGGGVWRDSTVASTSTRRS
jgi:hypothetical protein